MYDLRQFMPTLYLMVILGFTAFTIATGSPVLWVIAAAATVVNAWLVASERFGPIPRWLANILTLAAMGWGIMQVFGGIVPVLAVGQFLVFLQIIKLFEQRANRDYGQVMILSLLLVIAAAVNSATLLVGILTAVHLLLGLYGGLLFHLKVENDRAREEMTSRPERALEPAQLKDERRRLNHSMRRLTGVVGLASVACGVVVFVTFPRGAGAGMVDVPPLRADQVVTGFSGQVSFQEIARITQNRTPVAYVRLLRGGMPINGTESLYLRGSTLDVYVSDPRQPDRWTWKQSHSEMRDLPRMRHGGQVDLWESEPDPLEQRNVVEQHIELEGAGLGVLFAAPGVFSIELPGAVPLQLRLNDGTLALDGRTLTRRFAYRAWSDGRMPTPAVTSTPMSGLPFDQLKPMRDRAELMRLATLGEVDLEDRSRSERAAMMFNRFGHTAPARLDVVHGLEELYQRLDRDTFQRLRRDPERLAGALRRVLDVHVERLGDSVEHAIVREQDNAEIDAPWAISPEVIAFALDPDVTGRDGDGNSLAEQRIRLPGTTELDERIARNIERYLHRHFVYSLDVTDARLSASQDPLAWFISEDGRRGHCEYFAGTMALALQALGIPARVVVGFKGDEFNTTLDRYIVRQSDAHAWVEVLTARGWITFDPTSAQADANRADRLIVFEKFRHLLDWVEYAWANHIVAFDHSAQENLIQNLETGMSQRAQEGAGWWTQNWEAFQDWLERQNLYFYSSQLMAWLIVAMCGAALGLIGWFVWEKWQVRRRALRIGLGNLSRSERRYLARQLRFYDRMLRVLERHGHRRRPHQTPLEFARDLVVLPGAAFEAALLLTDGFYRIRYGRLRPNRQTRRRYNRALYRLTTALKG